MVALKIHGNSSHLAPWHAKLGLQRKPFVATLGSLTPDGGLITVLDLVIVKVNCSLIAQKKMKKRSADLQYYLEVYPIAYLEFIETDDGEKKREGPRSEKEEAAAHDRWLVSMSLP